MESNNFYSTFVFPLTSLFYSHAFLLLKSSSKSKSPPSEASFMKSFMITPFPTHDKEKVSNINNMKTYNIQSEDYSPLLPQPAYIPQKPHQKAYERLEVGDIIYIKYKCKRPHKKIKDPKLSISKLDEPKKMQGVIIADFDFLVLALKNPKFREKHVYKCFKKALFEVESERTLNYGCSISYGDPIRLKHIYSKKTLIVRPKELNKHGGLDLILVDESDESLENSLNLAQNSKFSLIPGDKAQDLGEAAAFNEKVLIKRSKGSKFWSIPSQENEKLTLSISETGSIMKICKYLKNSQKAEFNELKGKRILNGDVIILRHRENHGILTVGDWSLRKSLIETKIKIANLDEKCPNMQSIFSLNQINPAKILESYQEIEAFLVNSPMNFNHFWEIQSITPLKGLIFDYQDPFRLKNLANGLFLAVNKSSGRPFLTINSKETNDIGVEFYFERSHSNESLFFQGSVRIVNKSLDLLLSAKSDENMLLFQKKKSGEMGTFSFEIQRFQAKCIEIEDLELISNCFNNFLDFYIFLQSFGMIEQENDQKNPSEFLMKYDYDQALLQEKALEEEVKRFGVSLDCLMKFLESNSSDKLKDRQLLIKELRVFEIAFLLAKLIDDLVYANINSKENKVKNTMKSEESSLNSEFKFSEKSAFFIAKKHLEMPIKAIFQLLVLTIQGNSITSSLLLENSDFFTNQLRVYINEIGLIFKQALRGVHREILQLNDQLMDWLGSLESLNENRHNIEDQTQLIEIISAALLDNQENSVRNNQQKVQMELFSHRGGSEMKKGLLRFGPPNENFMNKDETPVIILKKDGALSDFLTNNPMLSTLKIVKIKEKEISAAFYLEEFVERPEFNPHIRYISSVLTLIALLIKDRNMKVISKVNSLEISSQHILFCLKAVNFPLKLKASYWQLYESLYLDREPFNPISEYMNRCILWSDIKDFSLLNPTYHLLNLEDLKNPEKEGEKVSNIQFEEIQGLLADFWSEKGILGNFGTPLKDKLDFIYVFLQMTRKVIDLGYTSAIFNQKVFKFLAKTIENLLIEGEKSGFWLGEIMIEALKNRTFEEEFNKVLLEVCKIIKTYYKVMEIVQIHIFMRVFKENFEDFTIKPNFDELFTFSLISKTSPLSKSSQIQSKSISSRLLESKTMKSGSQIESHLMRNNIENSTIRSCELDVAIWLFLLENKRLPAIIIQKLIEILEMYFNVRKGLYQELKLIELIDGKKEEALYKELDGTPDLFGQVISPKKLEFQIQKVLTEFDETNKGTKDLSQRENKIRELNNVINKLLSKFKETLALEKALFSQMQNIIRNLQVHVYIFRLLSLQNMKKPQEELELLQITIEFFHLFCLDNEKNQDWVLEKIQSFLDLLFHRLSIHKLLIAALTTNSAKHDKISGYFDLLFAFLRKNYGKSQEKSKKGTIPFKFLAYEIIIILKSMLFDSKKGGVYPENQKKVLNSLLKHDFLLKFAKTGQYLEVRNNLLENYKRSNKPHDLAFNLTLIELLGFLANDFKLGILQLRKLLVFEQLKTLIYDVLTPYIFKKPYLRVVFSVYFLQLEDESSSISIEDLVFFLNNLQSDLQASYYFLEFLIKSEKNPAKNEEIKKIRQEIATNRGLYMEKPLNQDGNPEEKPKINKKNANIEGFASETRKILNEGIEYWKYLYGGSRKFNGKKDGLLRVLLETVKEVQKRALNSTNVSDILEKLRKSLIKLKTSLAKMEKALNINLTKFQLIIHEILSLFPSMKSSQKPILGNKEDNSLSQETIKAFLEKLSGVLEKKQLNVNDFERFYGFPNNKVLVSRDEFIEKTREIMNKLDLECEMKKEEIMSFVEAFTQFKKNIIEMSFQRFLKKLAKTIENKRAIYQREGLKNEKMTALRLEDNELSKQKKESLKSLIQWFEKDFILKAKDYEIQSMVHRFILNLKEKDCENVGGLLTRLLEVFTIYGKAEYLLKVLELFTEELKISKEFSILSKALFSTGIVKKVLSFLRKDEEARFLEMALRTLLNCLTIDSKKTQEEILEILQNVENRGLLIEVFSFLKTCLNYQENKLFKTFIKLGEEFKSVLGKTIRLLAFCCENCYQPFQNFLREQEFSYNASGLASSNLVIMTSELLGVLPNNPLDFELIEDILKTLMKYCLGPCELNQSVLSSNKTLFQFLNDHIYKESFDFLSEDPSHLKKIRVFHISVKLLLSLADANNSLENFIGFLDVEQLIQKMSEIYKVKIKPNVKPILNGENIGLEASFSNKIIETGFDIFILLSILKDATPEHMKLLAFQLDFMTMSSLKSKDSEKKEKNPEKTKKNSKYRKNKVIPLIELKPDPDVLIENKDFLSDSKSNSNTSIAFSDRSNEIKARIALKFKEELEESLLFYRSLVGNVEIVNKGILRKVFFPKPFLSIYLTENIHNNLLIEGQNRILKGRLEHLLRNMSRYKDEMLHFRMIGRLKVLNFLVKSWRKLKDLSLFLIFFIVIFLFTGGNSQSLFTINRVVTIIQLVLGVFVAIFCVLERFPMSMGLKYPFDEKIAGYLKKKHYFPTRMHKTKWKYLICKEISWIYRRLEKGQWKVLKIFLDYENLYNLLYLAVTVIAFTNPYFYSVMILDIIKRSKILQNIIRSVTENWVQMVKLAIFTICVLYIFSAIVYEKYPQRFLEKNNMYGDNLWHAFLSTMNTGLRYNGGLGGALLNPKITDQDYWGFWICSLSFYIIVNLLLVKLVFWIIIDTFRELRERRTRLEREIRTQCFICGIKKEEFELRGNGWQSHIYVEHNVYNYLDFALYIEEKDLRDCNELEKYVKEMLSKKNTRFFPMNRAMELENESGRKRKKKK